MLQEDARPQLRHEFVTLFLAFVVGCAFAWAYPKSEPLRLNKESYRAYYCGFGFTNGGVFGKRYYRVVAKGPDGYWEVNCARPGFNNYRAYYPNGRLQAEGEIHVKYMGLPAQPYPDHHLVRSGRYYDPKGNLVSNVADGTGTQTFFYPNGQIQWLLQLRRYSRVEHTLWRADGKVISHKVYGQNKRSR